MILQLDNVSLKRNGKWILRDIHWKVEEKENWVLYGLNGLREDSAVKYALLILFSNIRRDAGAWP